MTTSSLPRLILIGGFIVAAAAAPTVGFYSTPGPVLSVAQGCQSGEEQDQYTLTCTPFLVPNSPPLFSTTAANPDVPEIAGIPCIGHNSGACLGLAEEEQAMGPPVQPRSIISSSP
jgi:hypothetical protein